MWDIIKDYMPHENSRAMIYMYKPNYKFSFRIWIIWRVLLWVTRLLEWLSSAWTGLEAARASLSPPGREKYVCSLNFADLLSQTRWTIVVIFDLDEIDKTRTYPLLLRKGTTLNLLLRHHFAWFFLGHRPWPWFLESLIRHMSEMKDFDI